MDQNEKRNSDGVTRRRFLKRSGAATIGGAIGVAALTATATATTAGSTSAVVSEVERCKSGTYYVEVLKTHWENDEEGTRAWAYNQLWDQLEGGTESCWLAVFPEYWRPARQQGYEKWKSSPGNWRHPSGGGLQEDHTSTLHRFCWEDPCMTKNEHVSISTFGS